MALELTRSHKESIPIIMPPVKYCAVFKKIFGEVNISPGLQIHKRLFQGLVG